MKKNTNFIPSVNSSLRVLEFLTTEYAKSSTLSEISNALSINKSTCLRILKTLQRKEFVHFDEQTKQYKLGSYLIALGARAREVNNYIDTVISFLPSICNSIDQTVVLAKQIDPFNMAYIAKEESTKQIRLTVSTGESFPIIGGAVGKVYMAHLEDSSIHNIIKHYSTDGKLPKYTPNSITDPHQFIDDLKKIKESGIAETDSEHTESIYAIACPIFNSENKVILSIGAFIPNFVTNDLDLLKIRRTIKENTRIISNEISRYV